MALDSSIKLEIGAEKLIKRGLRRAGGLLADQLPLRALLPGPGLAQRGRARRRPSRSTTCRSPGTGSTTRLHAAAYTAVLFLAGIFGERPKSGKEVDPRHPAGAGAAGAGTLAHAEGGADRADGARRPPARRGGGGARLPGDGGAHRPHGGGHQRRLEPAGRRAAQPATRGAGLGGARWVARPTGSGIHRRRSQTSCSPLWDSAASAQQ